MDANDFIEMDLQLGEAQMEIRRLKEEIAAKDRRLEALQELFQDIIKTAQRSYSPSAEGIRRFPQASSREVSKEAF
jgi:DNA repair ATPase RecN